MKSTKKEFLRAKEAAELLAIAKSTFWCWVYDGRMPAGSRIGPRVTVWKREDLEKFLEERKQAEPGRG
jgi:excisionase family DNA binding protein